MIFPKRIYKLIIGLFILVIVLLCVDSSFVIADETEKNESIVSTACKTRIVVSMGDSFSAGEGIEPFYGSRNSTGDDLADWLARRSIDSWPGQLRLPSVGELRDYKDRKDDIAQWKFVAASGAVIWHMDNPYKRKYLLISSLVDFHAEFKELDRQYKVLEDLNEEGLVPDYITLTLGGNDLGFVPIVTKALLLPSYMDPGYIHLELEMATIKLDIATFDNKGNPEPSVKEKLKNTYNTIYNKASIGDNHPWLLVAGYPHLLNDGADKFGKFGTDLATNLLIYDPIEATSINGKIDYFNEAIEKICIDLHDNHGMQIKYIDVKEAFKDHEAYTKDPWINGVVIPNDKESLDPRTVVLNEEGDPLNVNGKSMHPTAIGAYKGYRKCVQEAIDEIEGKRVTKLLVKAYDADTYEQILDKEVTISFSNKDIECTYSKQILDSNDDGYATFYVSNDYRIIDFNSDVTIHVDGYKDYFIEEYPFKKETTDLQVIPAMLEKDNSTGSILEKKKITFGNYGGKDIDWIVLDENEEGMFLLSEKILDAKIFNQDVYDLTWEESDIRKWLNEEFYNSAFDSEDRKRILKTQVKTLDNPEVSYVKGGNDTEDYLFLLSFDEIYRFFENNDELKTEATEYAIENGANPAENSCCFWYLRTPGSSDRNGIAGFMYVDCEGGSELYEGMPVYVKTGIRPAMWISKDENDSRYNNVDINTEIKDGYAINKSNFPDDIFRAYISKEIDMDNNDILSKEELHNVIKIDLDKLGVSDLKGIEVFSDLQELTCINNNLSTLDLSQNKELKKLNCNSNIISTLDITQNELLEELICEYNDIKELDVSHNKKLQVLYCSDNDFTKLDVSHNHELEKLICSRLELTELDVSNNLALVQLSCPQNNLTTLDVSNNLKLKRLYCSINKIANLDLSNNTELEILDCSMNSLTSLNLNNNTDLKELQCYSNDITSLDLSNNLLLERLCCDSKCAPKSDTIKNVFIYN